MKIIGIGIGVKDELTLRAWQEICRAEQLVLQTDRIPLAEELKKEGRAFETLDAFYESAEDFDEFGKSALAYLRQKPGAVLCLLGNLSQHKLAQALCAEGRAEVLLPGPGLGEAALSLCAGKVSFGAAHICPASEFLEGGFAGHTSLAVTELDSPYLAAEVFSALSRFYPPEQPCFLVHMGQRHELCLQELPGFAQFDYSTTLVIDAPTFQQKACYDFSDFCAVIARLRAPNGCPWDREQTHDTLKACLVEECYEVLEAIDDNDEFALADELGDVLLQVVMHAAIAGEHGQFDMLDVSDGVARKMIRRHPHIFAGAQAKTSGEVLKNWDEIKRAEKAQKSVGESLLDVPKNLPALLRAEKLQKKAAHIGFDWPDAAGALEKVQEELAELSDALVGQGDAPEEAGDLLFSAVNLLRKLGMDAESALNAACRKFISRIQKMETYAKQAGKKLEELPPGEQDRLWDRAKMCKKS